MLLVDRQLHDQPKDCFVPLGLYGFMYSLQLWSRAESCCSCLVAMSAALLSVMQCGYTIVGHAHFLCIGANLICKVI